MLNLTCPLAFFDLETTGTEPVKDRIVEISVLKIFPDGTKETHTFRVNPGIPIPHPASKIHNIFDTDVAGEPLFKEIAGKIVSLLEDSDLAGFNSNQFDIPLLAEEFSRAGIDFDIKKRKFVDIQAIYRKMEPRNLGAAYKFYCGKTLENAHQAEADVTATFEVLMAQIERYPGFKNTVDFLAGFANHKKNADLAGRIVFDDKGVEVFNFGKHKGKPVEEVFIKEPSYYHWMMNGEFAAYTKKVVTEIYNKSREKKSVGSGQ